MFGYMTELSTVEVERTEQITAEGDDFLSLLFHFLDEFLFLFSADPFFVPKVSAVDEVMEGLLEHEENPVINL